MNQFKPLPGRPAGVYVHVPFCERLCPYCDFAVAIRREQPDEAYLEALLAEAELRIEALEGRQVRSIYFGGGTPSAWPAEYVGRMIEEIRSYANVAAGVEISVEANPVSATPDRLAIWKKGGVGRVSLGVQSFSDRYLDALGRNHDEGESRRALADLLDAGFEVSIDLILGGPGNDAGELERDLSVLNDFRELAHISVYQLTIEPRTVFWKRQEKGELSLPDEDATASLLELAQAGLEARGFERYEVSSYAKNGRRSRHNQNYWTGGEYLGLGMGAHSLELAGGKAIRSENTRSLKSYLDGDLQREIEELDPVEHLRERLFLAVRSVNGLDARKLEEQFGGDVPEEVWGQIESLSRDFVDAGLLRDESGVYTPTRRGYNLSDSMAEAYFDVG